jgi:hypothetical protein
MEIETPAAAAALAGDELRRLLAATLSPDKASVDAAAAGLDRAAADPRFPLAILAVAAGIRIPFLPSFPPSFRPPPCNFSSAPVPAPVPLRFSRKLARLLLRCHGVQFWGGCSGDLCRARSGRRQRLLSCFTDCSSMERLPFSPLGGNGDPSIRPYLCVALALQRVAVTVSV